MAITKEQEEKILEYMSRRNENYYGLFAVRRAIQFLDENWLNNFQGTSVRRQLYDGSRCATFADYAERFGCATAGGAVCWYLGRIRDARPHNIRLPSRINVGGIIAQVVAQDYYIAILGVDRDPSERRFMVEKRILAGRWQPC